MDNIKIALLQILPNINIKDNIEKGIEYCLKAKKENVDIILFPEMWSNGYNLNDRLYEDLIEEAVTNENEYLKIFKNLAEKIQTSICITYLKKENNKLYNSLTLFDRFGKEVFTYSKVHTCDFGDEKVLSRGEDFYVEELDTIKGKIKVGSMICYDREFPESARILMLKGAEVILVPNACPMEINRLSQLRGRAYENMLAIATCNYPYPHPDCNGNSSIFDGVVYYEGFSGSRDTCVLQASKEEGIYIGEINMNMLRDYREQEVHGNSYRVPSKYKILLDENVNYPFIRNDKN